MRTRNVLTSRLSEDEVVGLERKDLISADSLTVLTPLISLSIPGCAQDCSLSLAVW